MRSEALTLFILLTAMTAVHSADVPPPVYNECKIIYENVLDRKAFQTVVEEQQEVLGAVLQFMDRGEWA